MDALLIWYFAVAVGCAASVRHTTRDAEPNTPHVRTLPPWLANLTAYTEPIPGYEDPLFTTESKEDAVASKDA